MTRAILLDSGPLGLLTARRAGRTPEPSPWARRLRRTVLHNPANEA